MRTAMLLLLDAALILAGWALLLWALLTWRLTPRPACPEADPHAAEVAEFRRQVHDWDRP
jgi:hypothetical protein